MYSSIYLNMNSDMSLTEASSILKRHNLLFENVITLSNSPVIRAGHRSARRTSGGRLQLLPVVSGGPSSHPGLGVHLEAPSPRNVLVACLRQLTSLLGQLLCTGADMIGLEPAASSNVSDTKVI